MVKVKLNLLNIFALKTKETSIEYEGETVKEIISKFIKDYRNKLDENLLDKKKKKLHPDILILHNGKDVRYKKNYKTKLKDGDQLYLSFPISGG
ncbi:MAG: hypothetical protein GF317_23030 [Candidatus Lokiarchaeota archaeon]|nr:hypothetical protein [Candidatus Lokiarchaeota archaeon]MBD3202318.1 hypothetical protein [Candidatus Lokiarchaeota archaeon]